MNYESGVIPESLPHEARRGTGRTVRLWWSLGAVAIIAVVALVWMLSHRKPQASAVQATEHQSPTVTVIVPGRRTVSGVVAATGNLAARRELPVGVAGEGGMVTQVLVEPGNWVAAGQVLATIDQRVQTQQAAALAASVGVSDADARLAQANLDRAQALVTRGFISKADIDRLTSTRDAARARVDVARAQLGQQRAATMRLDIRAPAAGLVLERKVEPGQVVSPASGVLFRLAKGGEVELLARLGEADLAQAHVGQSAQVTPVGSPRSFTGSIWQVAPVIDPQTRQGIARIALGYDTALRPGGFASAAIVSGTMVVPQLPESAVQNDDRGSYVLIVGSDNRVARRPVKVGDVSDTGVAILSGLSGNEQVVLSAGAFLNPGEMVIPTRARAG